MDRSSPPPPPLAELLALLGPEVGAPLGLALERLQAALASRAPTEGMLLSVREPLRRARDAALMAGQIGRLASGRVQVERLNCALHGVLAQVVELRRREAQARGLQLRLDCDEVEVAADPTLLPRLLNALLDWALMHTHSSIELSLRLTSWPPLARLDCRFALRNLDQADAPPPDTLDGLRWQLVLHTAAPLGVAARREDEAGVCVTRLDFPVIQAEELAPLDLPRTPAPPAYDSQPFAGWTGLVVSADTALKAELAALMEPLGWALNSADTVDDAFQQVLHALPQAVVVDGRLAGADLDQWRSHVLAEVPGFCFVEVHSQAPDREGDGALRCARADLPKALPALLRRALAPRSEELTFRL